MAAGDWNTTIFQSYVSQKKQLRTVKRVELANVGVVANQPAIEWVFLSSADFTSSGQLELAPILDSLHQNASLSNPFTSEEVHIAQLNMHLGMAPGIDGMIALFYPKYWDVVGSVVSNACFKFLNVVADVSEINKIVISLILKVSNPTKLIEFRPISLCTVIYKIISKVLVR